MTRRIGGSAGSPNGSVHSATPLASIIRSATSPPLTTTAGPPTAKVPTSSTVQTPGTQRRPPSHGRTRLGAALRSGRSMRTRPPAILSARHDLGVGGHPRGPVCSTEGEGQSASPSPVGGVTDLQVEVGLGAVARVATPSYLVAHLDSLAPFCLHTASLQMGEQHVRAFGSNADHHVVPGESDGAAARSSPLSQHVGDEGEGRASGRVIGLTVVDEHDPAGHRSEDGAAEPHEDLR